MRAESARKHEELMDLLKNNAFSSGRAKEVEEWEKWRDLNRAQQASDDIISNPKSQIFAIEECDDGSRPEEHLDQDFSNDLDGQHSADKSKPYYNTLRCQIMMLKWGYVISIGQICTNVRLKQEPVPAQRRTWDPRITHGDILKQHLEDKFKIDQSEANLERFKIDHAAINSEATKQLVFLQATIEKNKVEADQQFAEIMNALKALQPPTTLPAAIVRFEENSGQSFSSVGVEKEGKDIGYGGENLPQTADSMLKNLNSEDISTCIGSPESINNQESRITIGEGDQSRVPEKNVPSHVPRKQQLGGRLLKGFIMI
ncbi:hypothetical protein Tco_0735331 [Tanacetum coccineum]